MINRFFAGISSRVLTPQNRIIALVAAFIMATGNMSLFHKLLEIYPLSAVNFPFLLSLTAFFTSATMLFLVLFCHGRIGRWLLVFFLLAASQAAYYMDSFGVVIDTVMFDNIVHTNPQEAAGLMSFGLAVRTLLFGILPAWLVVRYWPKSSGWKKEFFARLLMALLLLVSMVAVAAPFTANYASFIRQHKTARYYANPTYFSFSGYNYLRQQFKSATPATLQATARDAVRVKQQAKAGQQRQNLVVLVVGETARADHFSLNGYQRETNPELKKQQIISFANVSSCGTSTGVSVPCMFSAQGRRHFDLEEAAAQENLLDVLKRNGVEVLWRDNNSDSKGVATRVEYQSFRSAKVNPVCDPECRDVGMLHGLEQYIEARKNKDIFIVLHQMGNHGPEYYKRYPAAFERFTPVCKDSELSRCSNEEISNAFDNAVLYTDYFLSQVIDFLKKYDDEFATAMLYVSDHGESLGENGLYLHAAPYAIAPKAQTHVPAVVWLGNNSGYGLDQLRPYQDAVLSHDDLFCAGLVAFQLDSKICESKHAWLTARR